MGWKYWSSYYIKNVKVAVEFRYADVTISHNGIKNWEFIFLIIILKGVERIRELRVNVY